MLDPHEIQQIVTEAIIFGSIMATVVGSLIGIASHKKRR